MTVTAAEPMRGRLPLSQLLTLSIYWLGINAIWTGLHVLVLPKRMEALFGLGNAGLGLGLITIAGVLTAIIATTIGILACLALIRHSIAGQNFFNMLLISPVLVPETVLAVGLLLFMRWLDQPRSFAMLLMGHVLLALPFVVLVVQARLIGIRRVYEEASRSLGANSVQTFFEVTLPLLMPAVFAGMLFAFTISFDNITATLFWRPAGMETVPTQIFGMLRHSISPEINALGTVMIVITVGLPLLAGGLARYFARARV